MLGWRSRLYGLLQSHGRRHLSTGKKVDKNYFSSTILLPKTRFPLRNDPSKDKAIQLKTTENLYRWQWENAQGPLFVFHDGPPYANGDLHMGHALNKILKDIINRYHALLGERVHYIPGWDCHGLPIEQKVLKSLGKDVSEVSSVTIRREAEKYAQEQVESQLEQFRHLGIMAGWTKDTTYRTLDHDYEMRQLRIFQKMVERGLIYRQYRPVHYSPSSRSALAEAELDYKDAHVSHSVYVSFELDSQSVASPALKDALAGQSRSQLLVWTTTPWTLTANMGIAVNPELDYTIMSSSQHPEVGRTIFASARREAMQKLLEDMELDVHHGEIPGSALAGAKYRPLFHSLVSSSETLPILPSSHVTPESGTGLVHCAPAHGHEDYGLFRSLGLASDMLCHVDGLGQFIPSVSDIVGEKAEKLAGKDILGDGGKVMVEILKELGVVKKVERIKHRYPYDWKTDKPVIIMATSQWFANLDAIKEDALAALKDVHFYPPVSRNRLEAFVRSRSEWCISRQRVWGVPIPALYHLPTNRAVLTSDSLSHILSVLEEKGTRHWWDGPIEDFVPASLRVEGEDVNETWAKGTDTMDVWFDSGTSWSMLVDLAKEETSQKVPGRYADVCLEGSDQHRGWFQSQLLTAVAVAPPKKPPIAPYGALITHGMVLDEEDKKMSKSKGNILSPLTVINGGKDKKREPAYGAEVLRLWVATVEVGKDMNIGPTVLSQCVESLRKIRNSARFLLGNLHDQRLPEELKVPREQLSFADRYVMHKLYELEATAREGYTTYNFPKVVSALSNFANITLSTLYFDITKDALYCDAENSISRRGIVTVMEKILDTMTSVMAPIVPHLAEEVHAAMYPEGADVPSVFCKPWQPLSEEWHDPALDAEMAQFLQVRDVVLGLLEKPRRNKQVKTSLMADVDFVIPSEAEGSPFVELLRRELESLKKLLIVSQVELVDEGSLGTSSPAWVYTGSFSIPDTDKELSIRVRPAELHKCPRCWTYVSEEPDSLCGRCSGVVHA